jgi:hypothetical protein
MLGEEKGGENRETVTINTGKKHKIAQGDVRSAGHGDNLLLKLLLLLRYYTS